MADPPAPRSRRWLPVLVLAALTLAVAAFGGLVLPRFASEGIPVSMVGSKVDPTVRLVRVERDHLCRDRAGQAAQVPALVTPADR